MVAFPLSPVPAYYAQSSFPNNRNGVFYVGGTPVVTLSKSGATGYTVRDYYGNIVSSGSMSGTTCTPTAPVGGWLPGWYRVYFTGANTDSLFGPSYGGTNFVVLRSDARFKQLPSTSTSGGVGGGESPDFIAKGILGLGTSRLSINNASSYASDLANVQTNLALTKTYWAAPGAPYADTARARLPWVNFPNAAYDSLTLPGTGATYVRCYPLTPAIDGSTTFVSLGSGSVSGAKVTVYSPNSTTVVETYDNLASSVAATAAINAASAYIKVFDGGQPAGTLSATAIGRSKRDGVAAVVAALYPDVSRFEGPENEPTPSAETAHKMRLFQAAVHAGNAAALAIGPCSVDILNLAGWAAFLTAGGGGYCDEFAFHDYNSTTNGCLPLGRTTIEAWLALLTTYGLNGKTRWQTEAGAAFTPVYGVYHPRRARVKILHTLLWEQYGIPREKNSYWYDLSHGFWSFPTWWQNEDGSLNPDAPIHRTLAEETFGMTHTTRLAFGTLGDQIALGSVYSGAAGSVAVLIGASWMPTQTVTLTITGTTSPLTVVDAFGNTTTATIANGRVTVNIQDIPTYVRLPSGVTASVYTYNGWPQVAVNGQGASSSAVSIAPVLGGAAAAAIADGGWLTSYGSKTGMSTSPLNTSPDTAVLWWRQGTRADRVVIWCGMSWQLGASLLDFDVQTSLNGSTWTTQGTVSRPAPTSFQHGTDSTNVGCQRDTYWDEQWIFDVPFTAPVSFQYLRLYVRSVSYGGEPDAAAVVTGGQGDSPGRVTLQEIAVLCDDNTLPYYMTR